METKIKKITEEMIIEYLSEMEQIREATTKAYAQYQKAMLDGDLLTMKKAKKMEKEHLKHKIKHFEKFIDLIVNVRNLGNRRNGYQKRHFLMEMDGYKDNLKELKRMDEKNN